MTNTFNTTNPQSRSLPRTRSSVTRAPPTTNGSITNMNAATTGMAEYTTSNLGGQLDGDLITRAGRERSSGFA